MTEEQTKRDTETVDLYKYSLRRRITEGSAKAKTAFENEDSKAVALGMSTITLMTEYRKLIMEEQEANTVGSFMGVPAESLDFEDGMTVIGSLMSMMNGLQDILAYHQAVLDYANEAYGTNLQAESGLEPPRTDDYAIHLTK